MSFFFDIFNPSFLIFLGLLILFLACFILYFESKSREQNHKISSMVSLVSSLAEEMNHTKLVLNTLSMMQQQQNPIRNSNIKDDLIPVSDEEDADDDDNEDDEEDDEEDDVNEDEDEDEKDNEDGLREIKSILFDKTIHDNMNLDEIVLNDRDSEQDNDESILFSQGAPISLNQIMASIFQNAHMVPFRHQQDVEQNEVEDLEQNEVEELEEVDEVDEEVDKPVDELVDKPVEFQDIKSIDLSSINISNEPLEPSEKVVKKLKKVKEVKEVKDEKQDKEDKEENEEKDFKKMSIQRLRTVVLEKQLAPDPSKLKKQELLKLLE